MSEGATVPIVKVEQEKVVLDSKVFRNVLQQAKTLKSRSAVVSICGECGTGKSYLANCFLQYLCRNASKSESVFTWLSDITWNSVTEDAPGIYLYKDIFKINDIAIVLLQVQGSFTNDDGRDQRVQIFTLATLLSNVQIFNLKSRLQGNDVLFMKDLIEDLSLKSAELELGERLDMKLCFLIRDWPFPRDTEYGFQGGKKYFDHATENSNFEESTKRIHLNTPLRNHFKTTNCFLMPHPWTRTTINKKGSGFNSNFKNYLREFLESILHCDELSTSKFGPDQTDGQLLLEFAEKCLKERSDSENAAGANGTFFTRMVSFVGSSFRGGARSKVPSISETKTSDTFRESPRVVRRNTIDIYRESPQVPSVQKRKTSEPSVQALRLPSVTENSVSTEKEPKQYLQAQKITEHKAFRIVDVENQQLNLNEELFDWILSQPEIGDKPVALVSIAGAFRMGKSFILSFLLRYMKNKGYLQDSDKWLGDKDVTLTGAFEWSKGVNRHTEGIVLYSQPFLISTKKYGEVVVLFMDTQGLFDSKTTNQTNLMIFAFNAIVSSVQILNVSKNIQENDLNMLQFYTEYTKTVQSSQETSDSLQSLKFLVRDWESENDFAFGGEGGKKYLDSYLETDKSAKELNSVREYITASYGDISCFLMPHPGQKFVKLNYGTSCITDLDRTFVKNLTPLMRSVLHPNNLVIKTYNRKPLNARGLFASGVKYANAFKSGNMPKVPTIMDCVADAISNEIRKDCLDCYATLMNERYRPDLSEDELKKIHKEAKREAIEMHYSKHAFGGSHRQNIWKNHVKKEIDDNCKRYLANLRHSKTKYELEISEEYISALNDYKNKMQKETEVPKPPEKFEQLHERYWHVLREKVENMMKRIKGKYDTLVKKTSQDMKHDEQHLHSIYKRRNTVMHDTNFETKEILGCSDPQRPAEEIVASSYDSGPAARATEPGSTHKSEIEMKKIVSDCLDIFDKEQANIATSGIDNRIFDTMARRDRERSMAEFDTKFDTAFKQILECNDFQNRFNGFRQELIEGLDDRIEVLKIENLRKREHYKLAQQEMEKRFIKQYHADMDMMLDRGYIPKKKLKEQHEHIRDLFRADMNKKRLSFYAEEGKSKSEDDAFFAFQNGVMKKIDKILEEKEARNSKNHGIVVKALSNFGFNHFRKQHYK